MRLCRVQTVLLASASLGLALGASACGQGLQLWPGISSTPAAQAAQPVAPVPERRIDLVAEASTRATTLYAALAGADQALLPNTALHAQRTISATGFAWPFFSHDATSLLAFEDMDGDGVCNAACGDRAWQVPLSQAPTQRFALAALTPSAEACALFAGLSVASPYILQLVADPNSPQANETLQVKVTSQNDDTTSSTSFSTVPPSGGVWRIPLPTSATIVSTTVNATGTTLQLALPLGQVLGDQTLAVQR